MAQTGVFVFSDGSRYEGEYVEADGAKQRHGKGMYTDGVETYTGEWKEDAMHGKGTFEFGSGAIYTGGFVANEFSGKGNYKFTDGATYEGDWKQNKMHGNGVYVDPEGVRWEGKFHNGKFNNGRAHITLR